MNLLFEIYGGSYPMTRSIPKHRTHWVELRNEDVGYFGNHDAVYYGDRLLLAIYVCAVQGVDSSMDSLPQAYSAAVRGAADRQTDAVQTAPPPCTTTDRQNTNQYNFQRAEKGPV